MAYTVQKGDTLESIAKKLGVKNWRDLWNLNVKALKANYAKTGNYLLKGQNLSTKAAKGGGSPSFQVGSQYANKVADPTRQGFEKKFGMQDVLRPDEAFMQFAEQQVNPEALRLAQEQVRGFDWSSAISGASASGMNNLNRTGMINSLDRQRQTQINDYVENQRNLFSNWYDKQVQDYMTAKNPSKYQLGKFGINVGGTTQNLTPSTTQYSYTSPIDYQRQFAYGGYYNKPRTWGDIIKSNI